MVEIQLQAFMLSVRRETLSILKCREPYWQGDGSAAVICHFLYIQVSYQTLSTFGNGLHSPIPRYEC
jgi:hypothetical protein